MSTTGTPVSSPRFSQDELFKATRIAAWSCWMIAIIGTILRTSDILPDDYALFIVIFMGFGIFFSLSLSRFKLTAAIRDVFLTGLTAATSLSGRSEVKLRELHAPTTMHGDLSAEVCAECAHRFPCDTV